MKFFGWEDETWQRALEWAKACGMSDLPRYAHHLTEEECRSIRREWLRRGGPSFGPRGLLLEATRG